MQTQIGGGDPERMKAQSNMKQQYATEHLHNSYYQQQQQKMIHSF